MISMPTKLKFVQVQSAYFAQLLRPRHAFAYTGTRPFDLGEMNVSPASKACSNRTYAAYCLRHKTLAGQTDPYFLFP
jgi:hypothetical protein